jgi:hypothetical protein
VKIRQPLLLATLICPTAHSQAGIPQEYDYSYQVYQEDDDRIRVESHYVRGKWNILEGTTFRMQYLNDAISGASPTGALPGGVQPYIANVEDVRTGILGALSQQIGNHTIELEISQSNENDYLSNGYALSDAIGLNQKNTTLTFGVNYLDDTVTVPVLGDRGKESLDFFAGVSQLLGKNSLISANLTLGTSKGYLNDPYKVVQRDEVLHTPDTSVDAGDGTFIVIPGVDVPVTNIYRENRPDQRFRQVFQLEGRHYFEAENATIDLVGRYTHDDYGVSSEMMQLEWRQGLGQRIQVVPFFRYYHQNAATFFVNTLNNVNVATPMDDPDGSGPNYSADYRLSSFDASSVGLRLRGELSDNISLTATYERYTMKGVGDDTSPGSSYPSANMFTVGLNVKF